jgi:P-type E1-E2 ATPase
MVGDIVEVTPGEVLSVDGILFEGSIKVDESSITGECMDVQKTVPTTYEPSEKFTPFLFSGSKVVDGGGLMVVVAVGVNSYSGKMQMKIQPWR